MFIFLCEMDIPAPDVIAVGGVDLQWSDYAAVRGCAGVRW